MLLDLDQVPIFSIFLFYLIYISIGLVVMEFHATLHMLTSHFISFDLVTWILISELFPPEIKGRASSIASLINWLMNFFISFTFLDLSGMLISQI